MGGPQVGIFKSTCTFPCRKSPYTYGNGASSFGCPLSHAALACDQKLWLRNQYFPMCGKWELANPDMEIVNHRFHMGIQNTRLPVSIWGSPNGSSNSKTLHRNGIQTIRLPVSILASSNGNL